MTLFNGYNIYVKNSQGELIEGFIPHFIGLISDMSDNANAFSLEHKLWEEHDIMYDNFISYVIFHCDKKESQNFCNFISFLATTMKAKSNCLGSYCLHLDDAVNNLLFTELDEQLENMVKLMNKSDV